MLTLFPDETIVTQSNDGILILTTHRICYEHKSYGKSYNQHIMLEHITSCENHASTNIVFCILAVGFLVAAGYAVMRGGDGAGLLAVFAVVFTIGYRMSKRNSIRIASPSTSMNISVSGMKKERVLQFINQVEQTKYRRDEQLHKRA